jgi:hypothetical protein
MFGGFALEGEASSWLFLPGLPYWSMVDQEAPLRCRISVGSYISPKQAGEHDERAGEVETGKAIERLILLATWVSTYFLPLATT